MNRSTLQTIKLFWRSKNRARPQYSLRALARDLQVSPSFVSEVFAGKKNLPLEWIDPLVRIFELDEIRTRELWAALNRDFDRHLKKTSRSLRRLAVPPQTASVAKWNFEDLNSKDMDLLNPWYNLALLELIAVEDFRLDFSWIAKELSISAQEAQSSWEYLKRKGFIQERKGKFKKSLSKMRLPVSHSTESVRRFHENLLARSQQVIRQRTEPEDLQERFSYGFVLSGDKRKLSQATDHLSQGALRSVSSLTQGKAKELYHLHIQLVPLRQKKNS